MAKKNQILPFKVRRQDKDILPCGRLVRVWGFGVGSHWEAKSGTNLLI